MLGGCAPQPDVTEKARQTLQCGDGHTLSHCLPHSVRNTFRHPLWLSVSHNPLCISVFAGSKRFFLASHLYRHLYRNRACGWVMANAEAAEAGEQPPPPGKSKAAKKATEAFQRRYGYGEWAGKLNVSRMNLLRFPCWSHIPW
jgi:hypothetical protein